MGRKMNSSPVVNDKGEAVRYAIYTAGGKLVKSTFSGGANSHDWKVGLGVRRRHAGLLHGETHRQREEKAGTYKIRAKVAA